MKRIKDQKGYFGVHTVYMKEVFASDTAEEVFSCGGEIARMRISFAANAQ